MCALSCWVRQPLFLIVFNPLGAFTFFLPLLQWDSLSPERRHLMETSSFLLFLVGIWSNRLHHGTFLRNFFLTKNPLSAVISHMLFYIHHFYNILSSPILLFKIHDLHLNSHPLHTHTSKLKVRISVPKRKWTICLTELGLSHFM